MEPVQPFRTGFVYNNFLYGLAAHVAELLSHEDVDWESVNKDRLFGPAGMASSGYIDKMPTPPGLARPYTHINGSWHSIDPEATRYCVSLHHLNLSNYPAPILVIGCKGMN